MAVEAWTISALTIHEELRCDFLSGQARLFSNISRSSHCFFLPQVASHRGYFRYHVVFLTSRARREGSTGGCSLEATPSRMQNRLKCGTGLILLYTDSRTRTTSLQSTLYRSTCLIDARECSATWVQLAVLYGCNARFQGESGSLARIEGDWTGVGEWASSRTHLLSPSWSLKHRYPPVNRLLTFHGTRAESSQY